MEANEEAVRLILAHQPALMAYLGFMIRDHHLAKDTFSDVTLAILNSWEHYEPERSFEAWARGIARRVALANLRKQAQQRCLIADDNLEEYGDEVVGLGAESKFELRKDALESCMEKLELGHRQLIHWRYYDDLSPREIAERAGKSRGSLYVTFGRLKKVLGACINNKLRLP